MPLVKSIQGSIDFAFGYFSLSIMHNAILANGFIAKHFDKSQ